MNIHTQRVIKWHTIFWRSARILGFFITKHAGRHMKATNDLVYSAVTRERRKV